MIGSMVTPDELMRRYCDGDASAFRELYRAIAPAILDLLCGLTSDRDAAEQLLERTLLAVHRARGAYVAGADPLPWYIAIAKRTYDHAL
jgi:RNA polymerase sigma-70 factor, ECF subfamily